MKGLRLLGLLGFFVLFASSASAQSWQASFNGGFAIPTGSGEKVGTAGSQELVFKQNPGFTFGGGIDYRPKDRLMGFKFQGSGFGTKAEQRLGFVNASEELVLWGTNGDIKLVCSGMSVCSVGKSSYEVSGSESRTRMDFAASFSLGDEERLLTVFGGLGYLNSELKRNQSAMWPKLILDKPSQVGIDEQFEAASESTTSLQALGLTGGVELEKSLGESFRLNLRGQLSQFWGTADHSGQFVPKKHGVLTTGQTFVCDPKFCPVKGLSISESVSPREFNVGVLLSYVLNNCNELGFSLGIVGMSGLPTVEYHTIEDRALVFGGWRTGRRSTVHVLPVFSYRLRF